MSTFDEASLVFIPSGYKTSKAYSVKPTSGDGDLTFTRSNDTATRVGPDGLIQKVRTNLLLQSNSFDTTWGNVNTTETSGQSDPNGGTTAWLLTKSASTGQININVSNTGETTFSLYMKAGTSQYGVLTIAAPRVYAFFDLSAGTTGFVTSGATSSITSIGGGWYRCSVTVGYCSYVEIYQSDTNTTITGTTGTLNIWSGQVESGVMTDFIGNTTTAAVSVGPVANVPRLDYLGSSCPRLLLEPQRQNVLLNSEDASSQPTAGTVTVSSNSSISPDGYQNADTITADSSSYLRPTVTTGVGTAIAWSLFLKNVNSAESILMVRTSSTAIQVNVAWTGAVPSATVVGGTGGVKVINYGNDWYRFEITTTSADNSTYFRVYPSNSTSASVISWGSQVELNASYSTSYIPTLGAAVTRGADAASKTGIASLIGQAEGTLFAEFNIEGDLNATRIVLILSSVVTDDFVVCFISGGLLYARMRATIGGALIDVTKSGLTSGVHKVAIGYAANDLTFYLDGVLVGQNPSASVAFTSPLSIINVGQNTAAINQLGDGVAQALLFPTRLSNAQLAELTA
jgi:hypothetical protein